MDLGILSLGYLLHPSAEVDYFRNVLPKIRLYLKKKKKFVVIAWWHRERGGFLVLRNDFIHSWTFSFKDGKCKESSGEEP